MVEYLSLRHLTIDDEHLRGIYIYIVVNPSGVILK